MVVMMNSHHFCKFAVLVVSLFALLPGLEAQESQPDSLQAVREYRIEHQVAIVQELMDLIEFPNVASNLDDIRLNAGRLVLMLKARGLRTQILEVQGAPPAVFGEMLVPGADQTFVFYAHYDGQPAVAEEWNSDPWRPLMRDGRVEDGAREVSWPPADGRIDAEWRLYGRSASDDKAPIVALLTALDALAATGRQPSANIKIFLEGEEEAGSGHLGEILAAHRELLAADAWIFCDGPVHQSRSAQVVYGVRGVLGMELTIFGPERALHSGHYGNWAPNPAALMAEMLSGMRDGEGRVAIESFYDDVRPLSEMEKQALIRIPAVDGQLREDLSLAWSEADNAPLMDRLMLPAFNIRGIDVGGVGAEARNAIPTEARASIDIRIVPDMTPEKVMEALEAHLRNNDYHVVHERPDSETRRRHARIVQIDWEHGYRALRTPMDLPVSQAVFAAVQEASGGQVIAIPHLGGSLPLYLFDEILSVPVVVVPMVNHDNNQHASDENLRLANLWEGIDIYANLMLRLGGDE